MNFLLRTCFPCLCAAAEELNPHNYEHVCIKKEKKREKNGLSHRQPGVAPIARFCSIISSLILFLVPTGWSIRLIIMLLCLSFSLPPVMTGLRKSPSTEAVWSPCPPPAETTSLWCDGPGRWRDEEKTTERATRRKMGGLGRENGRHLSEEGGRLWGYG